MTPFSSVTPSLLQSAIQVLQTGGLVAFPTETVYGLGADAQSPDALALLYQAKGRPTWHPVIVHIGHVSQLSHWAINIPPEAYALAEAFWPGPLTLILNRAPHVLDAVTGGQNTIALRIPAHPVAQTLLNAFGGGIAAPSANRFGQLSATTPQAVQAGLGPFLPPNSMILGMTEADAQTGLQPEKLQAQKLQVGLESTILDLSGLYLSGAKPVLRRPGMLQPEALAAVLGCLTEDLSTENLKINTHATEAFGQAIPKVDETTLSSPGSLASHYAPRTPLWLLPSDALEARLSQAVSQRIAILSHCPAHQDLLSQHQISGIILPANPEEYAQELYNSLFQLDQLGVDALWVVCPPETSAWHAIHDRLSRAAR